MGRGRDPTPMPYPASDGRHDLGADGAEAGTLAAVRPTRLPLLLLLIVLGAACSGGSAVPDGTSTPTTTPVATGGPSSTHQAPEGGEGYTNVLGSVLVFTDVTATSGIAVVREPVTSGVKTEEETLVMRGGAAVGDFDGDGLPDLFVVGADERPDMLFRNLGDGTFMDVAAASGLAGTTHMGSGAAVVDVEGDGDLDLYVTSHGPVGEFGPGGQLLYINQGEGTFVEAAEAAGIATTSPRIGDGFGAAFGDIDLDGDLDLFVAGWQRDGLGNRLFRNEGDGTYRDVTVAMGIVDDNTRGFAPCIVDMNGDRFPEILLVADFGTTRYWVNRQDRFVERTRQSGAGREWSGMGTAVADFDANGTPDWFVTAIFDDQDEGRGVGDTLYLNDGRGRFTEIAAAAGVADGEWGWGTVAADFDLDGHVDLVEVNGWPLPAYEDTPAKLWMNDGQASFVEVATATGLVHDHMALTVVPIDFDLDGDIDLAITSIDGPLRLFRNDLTGADTHWLDVRLDPAGAPGIAPHGMGAIVTVQSGDRKQTGFMAQCANYLSGIEPSVHVGLGGATVVDLTVEWADGTETVVEGVAADQRIVVPYGG